MPSPLQQLSATLGPPIDDQYEAAVLLFSCPIPAHLALGFIDNPSSTVDLTVAGRDLTIRHSRGLLSSNRKEGTTGAVVWKVTPLFAEWLAAPTNFLAASGWLDDASVVLELGAGVSGVVAVTLAARVRHYVASDQDYVLKLLRQNIAENLPAMSRGRQTHSSTRKKREVVREGKGSEERQANISVVELDWERDAASQLSSVLAFHDGCGAPGVDVILACDCIYNEALVQPLNDTFAQICRLRSQDPEARPTMCIIAQQLRSNDVFELWLESFHAAFHCWQVPDKLLTEELRSGSGFVVHIGILRSAQP